DCCNNNLLLAQQTTLLQSATIQSLSFYATSAAGSLTLGIYDASGPGGDPGRKMAETNSFTPTAGCNTANVISPVSLPAGTYWLAYLPSDANLAFRVDNTSGTTRYYSYSYAPMPASFSTTTSTCNCHWSLYATLTTTGTVVAPAPSATLAWDASTSSVLAGYN